jgi:hypothetical protein
MQMSRFSETLAFTNQTEQCLNPELRRRHRLENVKFHRFSDSAENFIGFYVILRDKLAECEKNHKRIPVF